MATMGEDRFDTPQAGDASLLCTKEQGVVTVPASNPPHTACADWRHQLWVICATTYHLATPALAALARAESIYKGDKFSDHAPITVDYDFSL